MTDTVELHIRPDIADRRAGPIDIVNLIIRNTEPDLAADHFMDDSGGQIEVRKVGPGNPETLVVNRLPALRHPRSINSQSQLLPAHSGDWLIVTSLAPRPSLWCLPHPPGY